MLALDPTWAPSAHARWVMRHLPGSVYLVAPEKLDALTGRAQGVQLDITTDDHWVCHYEAGTRTIRISIGAITVLWCFAHAYVVLHERVFSKWLEQTITEVNLREDLAVAAAMDLLQWGLRNWTADPAKVTPNWVDVWPAGTVHPIENPANDTEENITEELTLVSAAFLLHHELAHAYLGHTARTANVESVQQEQDADKAAVEWLLDGLTDDDPKFIKRALGIATALGAVTSLGIHSGYYGGDTHPRHFDRLAHALGPHITVDHHKVWQFVIAALKLHIDYIGMTLPQIEYESSRECFEVYLELLAEDAERTARGREA